MANKYYETENMFKDGSIFHFGLAGLNNKYSLSEKVTFLDRSNTESHHMILRNYESISRNLEVYPTVTVYPKGHVFKGGMGGFYHSDKNHIDLVDHEFVISILAHEMRHAFQYIYFPDVYYASEYKTVRGYLDCDIERDARKYSLDYCTVKQFWSNTAQLEYEESQYELVIKKKAKPKIVGLSNSYFNKNRSIGYSVPRDYHLNNQISVSNSPNIFQRIWYSIVSLFRFVVGAAVTISIIFVLVTSGDEEVSVHSGELAVDASTEYEYVFDEASLTDFINAFRYNYELALYYEDFSYIADQVQAGSTVYNDLADYIDQISGLEMVFDFTDLIIEEIEIQSDHAIVHTYEAFDFMNAAGEWTVEERNKRYKVIISEEGYYNITEINMK